VTSLRFLFFYSANTLLDFVVVVFVFIKLEDIGKTFEYIFLFGSVPLSRINKNDAVGVGGAAVIVVLFLFNKRLRNRFNSSSFSCNSFSFSCNSNCIFALTTSVLRIWFTEKNVPYITYLKAAALLLNALERQRVSSRPAYYSILTISYSGTSPNLSAMICFSTTIADLSPLVGRLSPLFMYICVISGVFVYLTFFVALTLLDDLFFCILLYTLVSGLLDIFFGFVCFILFSLLETFIFAGLFAVKCCQIGLLFSFASSFTLFMLCSTTGFHLFNHFFSCLFVSSSLVASFSSNISVHLPVVPFLSTYTAE
jgi:hypothetical protein